MSFELIIAIGYSSLIGFIVSSSGGDLTNYRITLLMKLHFKYLHSFHSLTIKQFLKITLHRAIISENQTPAPLRFQLERQTTIHYAFMCEKLLKSAVMWRRKNIGVLMQVMM